jgi:hypothetical protein
MARAGARSMPSVTSWLRGFMFSGIVPALGPPDRGTRPTLRWLVGDW